MEPYAYAPLSVGNGEFRLLTLHPGEFDDPIEISIATLPFRVMQESHPTRLNLEEIQSTLSKGWTAEQNLEGEIFLFNQKNEQTKSYVAAQRATSHPSLPTYECLSYTWGAPGSHHIIRVTRPDPLLESQPKTLTVGQNLHEALKYLRMKTNPRTLWIDAICINQEDVQERSQQVGRMATIFQYAQRVIAWIGLATVDSSASLHLLQYIGQQIEYNNHMFNLPAPGCKEKNFYQHERAEQIDPSPEIWHAIKRLLGRPYFKRLWIIQEIQFSNSSALIQCGDCAVLWRNVRRGIIFCSGLRGPTSLRSLVTSDAKGLAFNLRDNIDPVLLFIRTKKAECSDPRDYVYALLGLLPKVISGTIKPSYTQTAREVYRQAFTKYVQCSGKLDLLVLSGPSWKPDWPSRCLPVLPVYSSSNSAADTKFIDNDVMRTIGTVYDTIDAVAGPLPTDIQNQLSMARTFWISGAQKDQKYPGGEDIVQASAWTFEFGYFNDKYPWYKMNELKLSQFQEIFHQTECAHPKLPEDLLPTERAGDFLFKTKRGYIGITINTTTPGDIITILLGCARPVILRAQIGSKYLFVGTAYIHGLMDGEALLGPLPKPMTTIIGYDRLQHFWNTETAQTYELDPRLGPLPEEWREIRTADRLWPLEKVQAFQNTITGQVLHSDPRLLPDALRARGVKLEELDII